MDWLDQITFQFVYAIRFALVCSPFCGRLFKDTTVRLNVEENQLVNVFGKVGICLGSLKSA